IYSACLLKIGKLGYLHTIKPYLPSQPPGTKCWGFPVILYKTDVMLTGINTDSGKALQIYILNIFWRWLHYNLILIVMLKSVRIVSVSPICRPSLWFHIGSIPRFGSQYPQKCCRVKCPCPNLCIIGLHYKTTLFCPEFLKR